MMPLRKKAFIFSLLTVYVGAAVAATSSKSFTINTNVDVVVPPDACVTTITAPTGGTAINVKFDYEQLGADNKGALSPVGSDTAPRYISIAASGGDSCTLSGIKVDTTVTTGASSPFSDPTGVASIQAVGSKGAHWLMAPLLAHIKSVQVPLDGSKPTGETANKVRVDDGTKTYTYTSGEALENPVHGGTGVAGIFANSHPYYATQVVKSSGPSIAPMARAGMAGSLTLKPADNYAFKSVDIGVGLVMAGLPWNSNNQQDKDAVANGDTANLGFTVTVTEV